MHRIYTKTGDKGYTRLYSGEKVPKFDLRLEVVGDIDELNSLLGIVLSYVTETSKLTEPLLSIQKELFKVGADLSLARSPQTTLQPSAKPEEGIPTQQPIAETEGEKKPTHLSEESITQLEAWIDLFSAQLSPLTAFILPGGATADSFLHLARAVCRRAERHISLLVINGYTINPAILKYLNRLSDLLFVMARLANDEAGVQDIELQ